jgi:hypothetical protein
LSCQFEHSRGRTAGASDACSQASGRNGRRRSLVVLFHLNTDYSDRQNRPSYNGLVRSLAACLVLASATLWGHHSAQAEYDASRLLVLTGTVTKLEWSNPHVHFYLAVKQPSGSSATWYLELASPNVLRGQGWLPNTIKPGDVVRVEAYPARDRDVLAKTHRIQLADGRWLVGDSTSP